MCHGLRRINGPARIPFTASASSLAREVSPLNVFFGVVFAAILSSVLYILPSPSTSVPTALLKAIQAPASSTTYTLPFLLNAASLNAFSTA
ncbi:hypothetical protein [Pyrobaculum calidifontis]|uniref:hypothetical protein n=1 Tax=Pyrobaculum calidifontis TaxID=181486 RepID=UPI00186B9156|nr:hypothetical protein [Pyrobaculum calidifontis]